MFDSVSKFWYSELAFNSQSKPRSTEMPVCTTCNTEKTAECFYERRPGLLRKDCAVCVRLRSKKSADRRVEEVRAYKKQWRSDNKEYVRTKAQERYDNRLPEYNSWTNMKARCNNPKHNSYLHYGAKGIKVCERWNDFDNFLADMGPQPTPSHSIDRIDVTKGYEPGNCRWATNEEQRLNRTNTRRITINGVTKPVKIWAKEAGIGYRTLKARLDSGWTPERAVSTPIVECLSSLQNYGRPMEIS